MAVLEQEPTVYPEDLFSSVDCCDGTGRRWWAIHTRPRAEKALARRLYSKDVAYFLPMHERQRRVQRRLVRSYIPLFPGYLFLKGSDDERRAALETNYVATCLAVESQQQLFDDLRSVHELIASGVPLTPEHRVEPGRVVQITGGPLAGHRGMVLRRGCGRLVKFFVEIKMLQRGVSVEVDASMIQPV